jgi:hypothetical protein
MLYSLLADAIVAFHSCFVGYVVIGQLLIWIGVVCHWGWVRNAWFRSTHLLAILIVAMEAFGEIECPLTTWEFELRRLAGQPLERATFIGRCLHAAIFVNVNPVLLNAIHILFALLVLVTFVLWPPKFGKRC